MGPPRGKIEGFRVRGVRLFGLRVVKPSGQKINLGAPVVHQLDGLSGAGNVRFSPTKSNFSVGQPKTVKLNQVTDGHGGTTSGGKVEYLHCGFDVVDWFLRVFRLGKYREQPGASEESSNPMVSTPDYGSEAANKRMNAHFQDNTFKVGRGLKHYGKLLGSHLSRRLSEMGEGDHWIDGGAGRAFAMRTYLKKRYSIPKPRMTAVAMQQPNKRGLARALDAHGDRFRYLSGRPIEELTSEEVGRAGLITDIYGALSYTPHVDQVMAKYLELLDVGGELQAMIPLIDLTNMRVGIYRDRHDRWRPDPKPEPLIVIKDAEGNEVTTVEWIQMIEGIEIVEVERINRMFDREDPYVRVVIRKTSEDVRVPSLELTKIQPGRPPSRFYKLEKIAIPKTF